MTVKRAIFADEQFIGISCLVTNSYLNDRQLIKRFEMRLSELVKF